MTVPSQNGTLIFITPLSPTSGLMLTEFCCRNATQTLEQIGGGGTPRRSCNGIMLDLTYPQFRQYQSVISCTDVLSPALDDTWKGQEVIVDCAVELPFLTGASPNRPVVAGSTRVEGHFTFYRPQLHMMIMEIRNSFAEWEAKYAWSATLVEVGT